MKKLILLSLTLVLFGCSTDYGGLKINKKITLSEIEKCHQLAWDHALKNKKDRKIYNLYEKLSNEPGAISDSPYYNDKDYKQFHIISNRAYTNEIKCYHDLGYRLYPLIK